MDFPPVETISSFFRMLSVSTRACVAYSTPLSSGEAVSIVVEHTPFYRSFAADCPILVIFKHITLDLSVHVVANQALRTSQQLEKFNDSNLCLPSKSLLSSKAVVAFIFTTLSLLGTLRHPLYIAVENRLYLLPQGEVTHRFDLRHMATTWLYSTQFALSAFR